MTKLVARVPSSDARFGAELLDEIVQLLVSQRPAYPSEKHVPRLLCSLIEDEGLLPPYTYPRVNGFY